jgi:hypothetical protein
MSQQRRIVVLAGLILVTLGVLMRGCGHYDKVNVATYEHAKALFSVCNRRDTNRLELCSKMIEEAAAAERISATEQSYLNDIIETARHERWEQALAMTRQLMVDQVE